MAATALPSTSHAVRKSLTMTSMVFLPARGTSCSRSGLVDIRGFGEALDPDSEEATPPVLKARPPVDVPVVVVAGPDVGVRRRQMTVEQRGWKARRPVVDVDVRAPTVGCDRDLNRRRAALLAVSLIGYPL